MNGRRKQLIITCLGCFLMQGILLTLFSFPQAIHNPYSNIIRAK